MIYRACFTLWLIAGILPGATAQFAFDDAVVGYAYNSSSGTQQFDYLYSRAQGDIVSLRQSTGVYAVQFHGVSPHGSFVPMAAWAGEGTCTIAGYGFGLTPTFSTHRWAAIHCFDSAGNPQDRWNQLTLFDEGSPGGDNPYLAFADSQEAAPSGNFLDLSDGSTHNPGGGTTTLTRQGVGQYNVTFNGLGAVMPADTTVQVIPFSPGSARSCRVDDWTLHFAGSDNARARIYCNGLPGSGLLDTRFVVLFTSTEPSGASAASATVIGLNQPSSWTALSGSNVHNPHGQVHVRWDDISLGGMHEVRFEWPSDLQPGVAFATPVSPLLHACSSSSAHRRPWESEDYLYVNVTCREHDGDNSASAFNVLMVQVTHEPLPDLIFSDEFEG
jgi:hypothetical protein